uniref:Uncharacterized protein n=1 Tax=Arundo donax TaxID=35708 RepID=A0A0A9FE02_ARUDO
MVSLLTSYRVLQTALAGLVVD